MSDRRNSLLAAASLILTAVIATSVGSHHRDETASSTLASMGGGGGEAHRVVSARKARPARPPERSARLETVVVPLMAAEKRATTTTTDPELAGLVWGSQTLSTKKTAIEGDLGRADRSDAPVPGVAPPASTVAGVALPLTSFAGPTIDDDKSETAPIQPPGLRFVPPDPIGAASPDHLVNVVNVLVNFYQQDGTEDFQDSLYDFFADLVPLTFTFDPKVVYDPFEGRFVLVTMDVTDTDFGDPANTSRILVAVSDDSDPNGTWCVGAIDAFSNFIGEASGSPLDHWAEYPGLAVDEEAVYITAEMRTFLDQTPPDEFGGVRLWIIDKAADGLYDCGSNPVDLATVDVFDPFEGLEDSVVLTSQPAQIYGVAPAGVGTFLVSKGNLTLFPDQLAQVVRIDDPLGATSFELKFVNLGDIEDLNGNPSDPPLPNAPQSGSAELIDTNDRRALDAVWRDNSLYFTSTIDPKVGDADAGQATAFWARIDTTNLASLTVVDQGVIRGEEIGTATHTFYPSIAVDNTGAVAIGFAASGATIFPGAYFTYRQASDPGGFTEPASVVQAGQAAYFREFGTMRNRWGDYTGTTAHPLDSGCFWIFNQYAGEQDQQDTPPENGRWETQWAEFCVGDSAIFADGFESGDVSAWSSSAP